MLLNVGPRVCHVDFPGFRTHIGKGVENMGQPLDREVLRVMVAPVNCLGS
jgi:hypothetical protein